MDADTFRTRMLEVDQTFNSGEHALALLAACSLREDLAAEPWFDGPQRCWPLYYELRALHALGRWPEALTLMEGRGHELQAICADNHAYACSLTMECATRAGRADLLPRWAARCFWMRLQSEDLAGLRDALGTALALADEAERMGHPPLRPRIVAAFAVIARRAGRADLAPQHP